MKILKRILMVVILLITITGCGSSIDNKPSQLEDVYQDLFKDVDKNEVTTDLLFVNELEGVEITYDSGKPEVLSNSGKISRQLEDTEVEVIVILKKGDKELIKVVKFTVIKEDFTRLYSKLFEGVILKRLIKI